MSEADPTKTPPSMWGKTRRWWLPPVVIGVALALAAVAFGDFRPVVERFYSVF